MPRWGVTLTCGESMMGRPKKTINWKIVDEYLQAQCDGTSIAGILGVHPDTLYNACEREHKTTFSLYSQQKKAEGKEILRSTMFKNAIGGNPALQIWLSKQYLDMRDKADTDVTTAGQSIQPQIIIHKPNEL
jgi:hypothetical protein